VKERLPIPLDFEVDKLTNSIENVVTGDSFRTRVEPFALKDSKTVTKKSGWGFNWKYELAQREREVYKLVIADDVHETATIQGLLSLEMKSDHIFMHLVENAPFNFGKAKIYSGVAANLVAYACNESFQRGFEGNVAFISKTQLIDHYIESLGAVHIGHHRMVIETEAALKLINRYFKT
jgi:hypothetical protein